MLLSAKCNPLVRIAVCFCVILMSTVKAQQNFQASVRDRPGHPGEFEATFTWDHDYDKAIVLTDRIAKAREAGGLCDPASNELAKDGVPYWMPRFFPKEVPAEVTAITGIKFASVDWQPCGHKDIVICHGESHYDLHFYYADQSELDGMTCDIGAHMPSHTAGQVICHDESVLNHEFFKLMADNIPVKADGQGTEAARNFDFCVDPTSAIPKSGIHFGDRSDTLEEWKRPVTILGGYACKLTFFEPMISWKWITRYGNSMKSRPWPSFDSGDLEYNEKTFKPLPKRWKVQVSDACEGTFTGALGNSTCNVTVTLYGEKCGSEGCPERHARCGRAKNCLLDGGALYESACDQHDAKCNTLNDLIVTQTPTQMPTQTPTQMPSQTPTQMPSQTHTPTTQTPTQAPTIENAASRPFMFISWFTLVCVLIRREADATLL
jgi:hypothetical protein